MDDFVITTILEFPDRAEGQVLRRGTKQECDDVNRMLPAIATSGESPLSARMLIVPAADFGDMPAGQPWICKRPAA